VKITVNCDESVPVQVDGEAWLQQPGVVVVVVVVAVVVAVVVVVVDVVVVVVVCSVVQ